jgi:splicing factor 3A subunit 1
MSYIKSRLAEHMATMDDSVILPPPDIRAIADKTAEFVSRNGVEFEARIIATNAGTPKFRFMNSDDVYRMYFDFKVREFREKRLSAAMESEQKRDAPPETPQQAPVPAPAAPEAEAVRWAVSLVSLFSSRQACFFTLFTVIVIDGLHLYSILACMFEMRCPQLSTAAVAGSPHTAPRMQLSVRLGCRMRVTPQPTSYFQSL